MAGRNGSGTYVRDYDFTADRDAGSPSNIISADKVDAEIDAIATALTASIAKDGQTTPTASLPMGGFFHTGVSTAAPVARSQYVPVSGLQDSLSVYAAAGGTVDAITAAISPAPSALVNGQRLRVRAAGANTSTTPTFTPNSGTITAKTIVKKNNQALTANDISGAGHELDLVYNSSNDNWVLLNPTVQSPDSSTVVSQSGFLVTLIVRNAQTGTTYTFLSSDRGKHVTCSNGSAVAVTLPQAGSAGFTNSWYSYVENIGAGLVTITPTTSTINGAATLVLQTGEAYLITSDGTNYRALAMGHSTVAETDFVAGSDTLDMLDASTGSRKSVTGQVLFDAHFDLTTDSSPATGDFVPTNDISASNVAKKATLASIQTLFAASQSQMEAASSAAVNVTPSVMQNHPGVCKGWVNFTVGAVNTASHNVTSITDTGTAKWAIVWATDFSSAAYCCVTGSEATANNETAVDTLSAGGVNVKMYRSDDTNTAETNSTASHVAAFGDQS